MNSLKEQLTRAQERLPQGQAEGLHSWLEEQEEELATFRAHCQDRHKQLETCLHTINRCVDEINMESVLKIISDSREKNCF